MYDKTKSELYELCGKFSDWYTNGNSKSDSHFGATKMYHTLYRGGITTKEELINASPKEISRIRGIGNGKLFSLIMCMKLSLEEEGP